MLMSFPGQVCSNAAIPLGATGPANTASTSGSGGSGSGSGGSGSKPSADSAPTGPSPAIVKIQEGIIAAAREQVCCHTPFIRRRV